MAFKYINGKIVPVKHKTVFGILAIDVSALSVKAEDKKVKK